MKFNKSLDWLKESDEENLLGDDELDVVDEELNEGLYVDPANYGNYDDLVDVVDKAGNPQKMTRDTYDKNRDSGEFKDAEPKEKEQDKEVDKEQTSGNSSNDNPYKFTMPPFDDEIINAVQDANSLDYEDGFKTFIDNSIDEDDEYFKLIYNLADGNANERNLNSSSYYALKKYLEALEDNNIGHNLFANRIRKALQNFG